MALLKISLLFYTILSLVVAFSHASYLLPEDGSPPVYYNLPLMKKLQPDRAVVYPFVAEMIYLDKTDVVPNCEGKIILFNQTLTYGSKILPLISTWSNSGIAGFVLIVSDAHVSGAGSWGGSYGTVPNHPFPIFETVTGVASAFQSWYSNQTNHTITLMMEDDQNLWAPVYEGALVALGYYILITSGITGIYAAYKLTLLASRDGIQANLPQILLSMVILGCLIRGLWSAWDPFGCYNIAPFFWVQFGWTVSYPLVVGGCLLISLYWHSMLISTFKDISRTFQLMKIPFAIIILVMFAFEITTSVMRGIPVLTFFKVLIADSIIYVIVIFGNLIYFTYTRIRLSHAFNDLNKNVGNNNKSQRLTLANRLLYVITVGLLVWIADLVSFAVAHLVPWNFALIWWTFYIALSALCLCQVLLIKTPQRSIRWIFCGLCLDTSDADFDLATERSSRSYR